MKLQNQVNSKSQEEVKNGRNRKQVESGNDKYYVAERGDAVETDISSPPEKHALMLARYPFGEQKRNLIMQLQQSHGNRYVQRLLGSGVVRSKLGVSQPGDAEEIEADMVADSITGSLNTQVQTQEEGEEEPVQAKTSEVYRQEEEEEEVQPKISHIQRLDEEEEESPSAGPEGPAVTEATAPPTAPEEPASVAIRSVWDAMVVGSLREAHGVLTGTGTERERADQALPIIVRAQNTIFAIRHDYDSIPRTARALEWCAGRIETITAGLGAFRQQDIASLIDPSADNGGLENFASVRDLL